MGQGNLEFIRELHFLSQWFPNKFIDIANELIKDNDKAAKEILETLKYYQTYNKLDLYFPYGHPRTLDIPNWSHKPWQTDFHNAGKNNKERMLISANGVGKCCSINTYISTPDGEKQVKELKFGDKVYSWKGEIVERRISSPFRKPDSVMYRVFFQSGDWLEITGEHQIYDGKAYVAASQLLKSVCALPQTNLECARLVLLSGVLRYLRKEQDFQFDCLAYHRLRDEQLLEVLDTSRSSFPLEVGVLKHSAVLSHEDDLDYKCTRSLQQACGHLSTHDVYDRILNQESILAQSEDRYSEQSLLNIQEAQKLQSELIGHLQAIYGPDLHQKQQVSCALSPNSGYNPIVAYQNMGLQSVWDFEVEDTHNYIAGGVINHNSISGGYETALHLTGIYPDWWEGARFDKAPKFWVGSITNEVQKDHIQGLLIGEDLSQGLGMGFIPKRCLHGRPATRQCGISGVVDTIKVKHTSGGISICQFKTYEQGWRKWQAAAPNGVWLDEEPNENVSDQKDIFTEVQTRLVRTSGIVYVTYTPLLGQTHLTEHFLNPKAKGIMAVTSTWDDAPHLKEEDKQRLIDTYPSHQVEARTKGVPMMGEGRVFLTPEDDIKVVPFPIPSHFARIKGIDFGIDHPFGFVELAWDRDKDIIYITKAWKKRDAKPEEHCQRINENDPWIPVAWPHDGSNREKSGTQIKKNYSQRGVKLLALSARYENDKAGSQPVEPIVQTVDDKFRNGELKVFSNCNEFFEEYRNYHRKDGKLSKTRDDILKALFYAVMMRRFASTHRISHVQHQPRAFSV